MSAPFVWILFPFGAAVVLWFFRRYSTWVNWTAAALCLVLALLAVFFPVGKMVTLGPLRIELDPALMIAGRRLVLINSDRPMLVFLYFIAAFWFAGINWSGGNHFIAPNGLAIVALLIAALAVDPYLYSALLIEMAVLLSIPMLVPPGSRIGQGTLRYLIFQTLAMPFILLAGWALAGVEANPSDTNLVELAILCLALGFAFWLAVFPFYTWLPLLAGEAHPYAVGFLFLMLPTANLLLGLDFLNSYGWLRDTPQMYLILRLSSALMIVTAGVWAAFQHDMGRLFGYVVIIETGFSLLAISLNSRLGQEIFTLMFLPRVIALGLWALSSSAFIKAGRKLTFEGLDRAAEQLPFASVGLATAFLALAGLPLLSEFPIRQMLLQEVATHAPTSALWVLAGSMGLLFSGFRVLAVLTGGYFGPRKFEESRGQIFLIVVGAAMLLLIGVFPRLFASAMFGLMDTFARLPVK